MPWNEIKKKVLFFLIFLSLLFTNTSNKGENTIYNACFSSEVVVIYKIEIMLNRKKPSVLNSIEELLRMK